MGVHELNSDHLVRPESWVEVYHNLSLTAKKIVLYNKFYIGLIKVCVV
jgi:hypothetical protein